MNKRLLLSILITLCTVSAFSQSFTIITADYNILSGDEIMFFQGGEYHDGFPVLIDVEYDAEFGILFTEIAQIVVYDAEKGRGENRFYFELTDIWGFVYEAAIPLDPDDEVSFRLDDEMMLPLDDLYMLTLDNELYDYGDYGYDDYDYDYDDYDYGDYDFSDYDLPEFGDWSAGEQDAFISCFEAVMDTMDTYLDNLLKVKNAKDVVAAIDVVYDSMQEITEMYPEYLGYIDYLDISSHPRGSELMDRWANIMGRTAEVGQKVRQYENDPLVLDALDKLNALNF